MKEKKKLPKILEPDKEQQLLDWTHQNRNFRDYVALLMILRTGLRTNELRELLVSDIISDGAIINTLQVRVRIARCEARSNLKARELPIQNDLREQLLAFLE